MKKTLLIILLLVPFLGISQTKKPIDGFFGIKFGADSATVHALVAAKGGEVDDKSSQGNFMVFDGIKFGTWKHTTLYVQFIDSKAYKISVSIIDTNKNAIIQGYNKLVNETNTTYGVTKQTNNTNNERLTTWIDKNNNHITISTLSTEVIVVNYEDAALSALVRRNK